MTNTLTIRLCNKKINLVLVNKSLKRTPFATVETHAKSKRKDSTFGTKSATLLKYTCSF